MAKPIDIRLDDLSGMEIEKFLQEHLDTVALYSPPESIHALDLGSLRAPGVTFWCAWRGSELMGCGALKELDAEHGEIKSMRTAPAHRRKGVGAKILSHILKAAVERGYRRVSLETGSMEAFAPARALYARFGFESCGPFEEYVIDPFSVFMTLEIETDLKALIAR